MKWRLQSIVLMVGIVGAIGRAQSTPCGITTLQTVKPVLYPPSARMAQIQGNVIAMVTFATSGDVTALNVLSGPEILKQYATDAMLTWRANPYSGPRECALVIEFDLIRPKDLRDSTQLLEPAFFSKDNQHFVIRAEMPVMDP